jgi:hypothetical protein
MDLESFNIKPYRSKRLKEYYSRMSKDREAVIYDDNVASMLLAQGFSIEEAPRSIYRVEKLYEALAKYAPGRVSDPEVNDKLKAGLTLARTCFQRPSDLPYIDALPFTPATIVKVTSNPQGSAGLTNYGCSKAQSQTRALERGLQTMHGEKAPEPCLAFSRTQFNEKTRLVWGYPYSETAIEGIVAWPLLQMFKERNTPMAFAMTTGALGSKLRVASYHKRYAYSIDMSSFDASISAFLIKQAFGIIKTWFDLDQVEPVSGITIREVFKHIEDYFIRTPIVMPDGNIYYGKRHGVPSGSFFTQMIDSIVNVIIAGAIADRFALHVDKRDIFVLGDDLLMWSNRDIELDKMADFATDLFGVKFNAEKSAKFKWDEPVHYLGRNWLQGVPNLDESEVIKRMVFPERFRRYAKDPLKRKREVKLLILSYASTYYCGWGIAERLLGTRRWDEPPGAIEVDTYYQNGEMSADMDGDHLTGLERFLHKYVHESNSDMPHVATQMWF